MIARRLQELGLKLPEAAKPLYHYVPVVIHRDIDR